MRCKNCGEVLDYEELIVEYEVVGFYGSQEYKEPRYQCPYCGCDEVTEGDDGDEDTCDGD